jgi:hypothetical protein
MSGTDNFLPKSKRILFVINSKSVLGTENNLKDLISKPAISEGFDYQFFVMKGNNKIIN